MSGNVIKAIPETMGHLNNMEVSSPYLSCYVFSVAAASRTGIMSRSCLCVVGFSLFCFVLFLAPGVGFVGVWSPIPA